VPALQLTLCGRRLASSGAQSVRVAIGKALGLRLAALSTTSLIGAHLELADIELGIAPCGFTRAALSELREEWEAMIEAEKQSSSRA
jgi:hypothetical protein